MAIAALLLLAARVTSMKIGVRKSATSIAALAPSALRRIFLLLLVNAVLFSVLGGALLTRYLLPMYPLVLLVAVTTLYRRVPYWHGLAAFSAAAFIAGNLHQSPLRLCPGRQPHLRPRHPSPPGRHPQLEARYPGATVLSAWPLTDELSRPELGYLSQPYAVYLVADFTAAEIALAAQEPEKYSAALVFSTKYDPHSSFFTLGATSRAADERYFGLHHDLPPEEIARQLHGDLVWKQQDHGQWIALIRFNRQIRRASGKPVAQAGNREYSWKSMKVVRSGYE